jgi:opacity protein-like surface antigen
MIRKLFTVWFVLSISFTIPPLSLYGDIDEIKGYFIQHARLQYFDSIFDARSFAMGGSTSVTAHGSSNMFQNPSGIAWLSKPDLSLTFLWDEISGDDSAYFNFPNTSFTSIHEDICQGYIASSIPIEEGQLGVAGFGFQFYQTDTNDWAEAKKQGLSAHLAFSKQILEEMTVGYLLSYHNDDEENRSVDYNMNDGFWHMIGMQYQVSDDWILGAAGFFGNGDIDSDIFSVGFQYGNRISFGGEIGISWKIWESTQIAASFDIKNYALDSTVFSPFLTQNVDEDGHLYAFHLGVEQRIFDSSFLRVGYAFREIEYNFNDSGLAFSMSDTIDFNAISAGLGWQFSNHLSIDAAIEYRFINDDDILSAVTINYKF